MCWASLACGSSPATDTPAPKTTADSAKKSAEKTPEKKAPPETPKPENEGDQALPPRASVDLTAADGVKVFADLYPAKPVDSNKYALVFHQAGSNAGEYAPLAPELQQRGYHVLAIDQRSGAERHDQRNRTVDALGKSTSYLEAYPDLEAALAWVEAQADDRVVTVWGSSYSAALVFKLAKEHPKTIDAVLAFSPGEYIPPDGTVAAWAAGVRAPLFVTSAPGKEVAAAKAISDAAASDAKVQFEPAAGVHGASILRDDANGDGAAAARDAVFAFLQKHG